MPQLAAMYYTPGWAALLTLIGTLSGGAGGAALTQWNQRWIYRRQTGDQHRLEQRESIASVLDASANLHDVKTLVHRADAVKTDHEARRYSAGLPLPASVRRSMKSSKPSTKRSTTFALNFVVPC